MSTPKIIVPPSIDKNLPSLTRLRQALGGVTMLAAGTRIFRCVRGPKGVIPPYVDGTYRFGPPPRFAGADGRFSTYWMYAAQDLMTALWESGFCINDDTQPGTFYIPGAIAETGLVAIFTLQADIPILDLDGTVLSKLGIYDRIHDHNYGWCQWFGLRMFEVLNGFTGEFVPIGFRYPSRKHKSYSALAIQSCSLEDWRRQVEVQVTRFGDMPEFNALTSDANYAEPLDGGFSLD